MLFPVLHYPALYHSTQHCSILPNIVQYYTRLSNTTQHCPILPNIVQYYPTQHCPKLPNPTLSKITQHCSILPNIVQYYPTLSNTTLPKHCSSPHNSCTFSGLNTSLFSTLHRTQLIFAKTSRSWIDSMINWYKFTALCLKILETYFRLGGFFPVSLKTGTQKRAKM